MLDQLQDALYKRALDRRASLHKKEATYEGIVKVLSNNEGFCQTGWCRSEVCEGSLKEHQASIRCLLQDKEFPTCFKCGNASLGDIIVAKSY